ncbi:MAG TPA: helix-turn-helix domain-containing protein, partial [Pseudosphingobacterium sp.]|nr:helix-turn-helix domain-containing protein [Pseudosphingobacterium sp.]
MDENTFFLVGQRLRLLRELLLLTVEEIYKIIRVPPTTLRRIENGDQNSIEKWTSKLCDLYQVNEKIILDIKKPLPNWKILRRNILSKYRNEQFIIEAIDKKPYPKKAIQFRV